MKEIKLKNIDDYVIVKDILRDKRWDSGTDDSPDYYYLYFERAFKEYDKEFSVNSGEYHHAEEGTEYYLIIKKGAKRFADCYSSKEYQLTPEQERILIDFDDLGKYTELKKHVVEVVNEQVVLNKEFLLKRIFKKKALTIFGLITVCLAALNYYLFFYTKIVFLPLLWILNIITLIIEIVMFITYLSRKSAISKDKFRVVKDKVVKINETLSFQHQNDLIEFTMEKTTIRTTQKFKYFGNVKEGDDLYLVFLKNKKNPLFVFVASTTISELIAE